MPSLYSNYGSPVSKGYNQFMGNDYTSSPIRYDERLLNLRPMPDRTTIKTSSNPQDRIKAQAERMYTDQQAQAEASRMSARDIWNDQIDWLNNADVGRDFAGSIYNFAQNAGMTPYAPNVLAHPGQDTGFNRAMKGTYDTTDAFNRQAYGGANSAMLKSIGIDPSQVSKAYKNFLSRNFYS